MWKFVFPDYLFLGKGLPKLTNANWLVLGSVFAAIMGWVVAAYITLRNSIKQHTINSLLQSRLSATYMQHAAVINSEYFAHGASPNPVSIEEIWAVVDDDGKHTAYEAVNYVLNYFEFLATGIRHGDLDRKMLSHTLRGNVIRLYEKLRPYIESTRGEAVGDVVERPSQFEHITWLYTEWKAESVKQQAAAKTALEKAKAKEAKKAAKQARLVAPLPANNGTNGSAPPAPKTLEETDQ
ncbi:MAG: hypothetical protein V7631_3351 [Massilia sp.]|jgi:hypothetical protein